MTKLFLDVLDSPQQVLWQRLKALSVNSCVLAGGTAIAMQIGHRISEDFDLFIPGIISRTTRKKALELMEGIDRVPLDDTHQLTILSRTGLKLTVVSHPHIPIYKLVKTDSNKAFTIGQRGKWRDYVDLYFLLKEKIITLDQLLNESKKRFKVEFDPRRFLDQLTFTNDLGDFNIEFIRDGTTPANISQFMAKQVKEYLLTVGSTS